jgi:hypothetical protein
MTATGMGVGVMVAVALGMMGVGDITCVLVEVGAGVWVESRVGEETTESEMDGRALGSFGVSGCVWQLAHSNPKRAHAIKVDLITFITCFMV